jgi:PAS domain-containing protein
VTEFTGIERSSARKNTAPAPTVPSEGWYEKLYHMLLGSLPFSLMLIDRSLRVVSANRNFLDKARRTEEDTIGVPMREVFPDAIMDFTHLDVKVRGVFDTGLPLQGAQMTYRAPGVPTRVYYYTVVPVKSGNVVQHAMLVMDDITEKVQLSEKARMVERHWRAWSRALTIWWYPPMQTAASSVGTPRRSAFPTTRSTRCEGGCWRTCAKRLSGVT